MTPPAKSAALQRSRGYDGRDEAKLDPAFRDAPARPAGSSDPRDTLLPFPGFEARAPQRRVQPAAPAAPAPDLGAELEAALMDDLQSMAETFDDAARRPAPPPRAAVDPDQEALERLLISIRRGDGAARQPAPRAIEPPPVLPDVEAEAEAPPARPARRPRETSPRAPARTDRMPQPVRARKPDAPQAATPRPAPRQAQPVPALQLPFPGARRAYLKPAIAGAALILLAAIGAGMTIRALTAPSDPAPASQVAAVTPTPASAPPASAADATAEAPAAAPAAAEPVRTAVDNSTVTTAAPAAEPKQVVERPPVALVEPGLSTEAPAAETSASAAPAGPATDAAAQLLAALPPVAAPEPQPTAPAPIAEAAAEPLPAWEPATEATAPQTTDPAPPAAAAPPAAPRVASTGNDSLQPGPGRVASGVNLRSNPAKGAPVIGVLRTGTQVEIVGCKGWCEVVAGERRGFVWHTFLAQAGG